MKKIYLILIALMGAVIFSSCNDTLEEMNVDTKHPTEVPGPYLFSNAQKALADQIASTNVNINNWKLWSQYWTETTYTDEANYDVVTRNIASNVFRIYYRDILKDLKEARELIAAEEVLTDEDTKAQQNTLHIIDLLSAFTYQRLVDIFGNVPYSEALDIENYSPKYDDASTIYKDLISKVKEAVEGLDDGYGSLGSADLYFGGDVAMWKKFGYSLLVKLAINLSDVDQALAKQTIEASYDKVFDKGEVCKLDYLGGINANPLYQDLIQSGRHDFVAANTIVDVMNNLNDPRRAAYFTPVEYDSVTGDPIYLGGEYGHSSPYEQFSHIPASDDPGNSDVNIADAKFPMVIMDHTEMAFYLAEAAERGFSVGKTAEEWYNEGITESMKFWLGRHFDPATVAQMTADYLANPDVAYTTAPGDWKQKIGTQAWIAYYYRGFVAFTSYRRLDYPEMNTPPSPPQDLGNLPVPLRMTYPIDEQTLNKDHYYEAAEAIGGDYLKTPIFWDKQ